MKLKLEKDINVAVEVDGKSFISSDKGLLYESITDKEIFLYIKNKDDNKEIKIIIKK